MSGSNYSTEREISAKVEPTEILGRLEPVAQQSEEELMRTKTQLRKTTEQFETQTEEDWRVSAERLQLAAAMTGFGIHDFNVLENLDYWSPELKTMNGYAANEEITFAKVLATIHPDDREFIESAMAAALDPAGDGEYEREFRIVRADDGETRWFYNKSRTIFIGDGAERRAVRNAGIVVDITDRKNAEARLQKSEERLRLLIESATDFAIFTISKDGLIDSWNAGAERIFGYAEAEIVGQAVAVVFTPEDRAAGVHVGEMKRSLTDGRALDERWHLRKDGTRFFASGIMQPLSGEGASGFVKIARDMTAEIKAEKAVRDKETLRKLVAAQEEERKRLARDLHDHLGQQLTVLRMKLERMQAMCEDDSELCGEVTETQAVARNIDADLNFLAWELRPATLDDLGLLPAMSDYIWQWQKHSGITAEFHASGFNVIKLMPEIETNIYRIAQEALNNIWKHARSKHVSVILKRRLGDVLLIIEDDGIGFDADEKKVEMHKGLGLAGMRERAALVGGSVEIESQPGSGTAIFVRVPFDGIGKTY